MLKATGHIYEKVGKKMPRPLVGPRPHTLSGWVGSEAAVGTHGLGPTPKGRRVFFFSAPFFT